MVSTAVGTPVEVALWWLGEDSPVTNRSALDFSKRDDVLVFAQILRNEKYYDTAATPLNFGVPAATTLGNVHYQLKAISSGKNAIAVQLNINSGADPSESPSDSWTSPVVRVGYGDQVSMQLPDRRRIYVARVVPP